MTRLYCYVNFFLPSPRPALAYELFSYMICRVNVNHPYNFNVKQKIKKKQRDTHAIFALLEELIKCNFTLNTFTVCSICYVRKMAKQYSMSPDVFLLEHIY
jgi:hypothetical protein